MIYEGSRVCYTGPGRDGVSLGDRGQVLLESDNAAHVMWATGKVTLVDVRDLSLVSASRSATSIENDMDDSLSFGSLPKFSARVAYDRQGSPGVFGEMVQSGLLNWAPGAAHEAISSLASVIRNDETVKTALASLDMNEADEVVRLIVNATLRNALRDAE